jgi:hypothetical protein
VTAFHYQVPGPVSEEVQEALNDRYGPGNWYHTEYKPSASQPYGWRPSTQEAQTFLDLSFVFKPADPTGYIKRK